MELNLTKENKKSTLQIEGELSIYQINQFKEELITAFDDVDEVVIDLAKVERCDTASFQVLVSASKSAKMKNVKMMLTNPQEQFIQSLKIIGCDWKSLDVN